MDKDSSTQPATRARINVYRAWAHLALKDLSSARDDARLALTHDLNVRVTTGEFPPQVVSLFEEVRSQARVWVYFPSTAKAKGLKSPVLCDGGQEADVENGRFTIFNASPGPHTIDFRDQRITATFEARDNYYFRGVVEGSGSAARYAVSAVSKEDGSREIFETHMTYEPGRPPDCGPQGGPR